MKNKASRDNRSRRAMGSVKQSTRPEREGLRKRFSLPSASARPLTKLSRPTTHVFPSSDNLGDSSKMGFSAAMQGSSSHAALLCRQDAELRLLECMKRVLLVRAKCDRDYGLALQQLAQTANKMTQVEETLVDSALQKAWGTMVDGLEEWSNLVRHNSDILVAETVEKMATLVTEKRASRKVYAEEHHRISSEVVRLQESVARAKGSYEQNLDAYKTAKSKYEEITAKGKGSKRQEELKERYQKMCKKLHHAHNVYVLLLCEAAEYERDFRTVLLPGLLEYQQTVQEDMIAKWKSILTEVSDLTDVSRGKFAHLQAHVLNTITEINPSSEYRSFTDSNKSMPPEPMAFEFSKDLLGEGVGSLQAGQLAVDSLTVDSLRLKLQDLEDRLREVSTEIKSKQALLHQHETEIANIHKSNTDSSVMSRLPVLKRASDILRRELNECRCREGRLQQQQRLIHDPLTALGCEEAQPPWDNPHINGDTQQKTDSMTLRSKGSALKEILKKPFGRSRNTGSASPASTPPTPTRVSEEPAAHSVDQHSLNNVSTEGAADDGDAHPENPTTNGLPELTYDPERCLEEEPWFHGVLPREEVVRLLVNEGDYLVRETTRNDEQQIVLSVCWGSHKHFIVQTTPEGHYRFEGPAFPTIQELILHQHSCGLAVTNKSGAILRTPIFRERWELNNDDVHLLDKIGRGNFGDVYKAQLAGTGQQVAVKTCRVTLPDEQKKKFLQEGRILKQYDHPNIVKFIGICVQKQPIMIVMELVPGGSLLSFVRNHKNKLAVKQLLGMCLDTASGMAYLESKNCIHRDLAARNCLVGHKNSVKISDFGMSREEEEYIVSDGMKQIPIKWTAPEALNFGKYTSLCDVWSFGVLCWEVFSYGEVPYHGYSNTKAREMIDSGYRMLAPTKCPEEMYELMLRCWQYEPDVRPHFPETRTIIKKLYDTSPPT